MERVALQPHSTGFDAQSGALTGNAGLLGKDAGTGTLRACAVAAWRQQAWLEVGQSLLAAQAAGSVYVVGLDGIDHRDDCSCAGSGGGADRIM